MESFRETVRDKDVNIEEMKHQVDVKVKEISDLKENICDLNKVAEGYKTSIQLKDS